MTDLDELISEAVLISSEMNDEYSEHVMHTRTLGASCAPNCPQYDGRHIGDETPDLTNNDMEELLTAAQLHVDDLERFIAKCRGEETVCTDLQDYRGRYLETLDGRLDVYREIIKKGHRVLGHKGLAVIPF